MCQGAGVTIRQNTSQCKSTHHAKAALASRRNVLVHLDVLVVKARVLAVRHGLNLEGDSGAEEGGSHAHKGKKEQESVRLHRFARFCDKSFPRVVFSFLDLFARAQPFFT
jgi:hypothetical protein